MKFFDDAIELDKSYFGGYWKGKRGRDTAGKVAVFGILNDKQGIYCHGKQAPNRGLYLL